VSINDAANGVFLSTDKTVTIGTYHPCVHTKVYYDEVNTLLSGAQSKQDVIDILNYIADSLENGTFPY